MTPTLIKSHSTKAPTVALIGVTGYASIYMSMLRTLHASSEVVVRAAVIINLDVPQAAEAAALLRSWGAMIYGSTEELFAKEAGKVDLCLIPTGIAWHARMSVAAMKAGMHVLVEKPLAGSLEDVAAIRQAETETGRWVAVGFQDVYSTEAHSVRNSVRAGDIGTVQTVRTLGLWPRPTSYYARNHWAGRLRADGAAVLDSPLNNAFAHFVNLALFFAAPVQRGSDPVSIEQADLLRANDIETYDTAVVLARSAQGIRYWFGFSHATPDEWNPEIHVIGSRGTLRWIHEREIVLENETGVVSSHKMPDAFDYRYRMIRAALARVNAPQTWICDVHHAARHTGLICAVQDAAPAKAFPPASVETRPFKAGKAPGEEVIRVVPGLAERMTEAFRSHAPLGGF